jgi:hypothetical protein
MAWIKIRKDEDRKKREKKENKKLRFIIYSLRILKAAMLLNIIVIAFIVSTPLFNFASISINFYKEEENEFRVGYPIEFGWKLSGSPSQAFILWGDGSSEDITKNHSGSVKHKFALQGRYSPMLLYWGIFGNLRSKSLTIIIENNILDYDIISEDRVFEGEEVVISVDSVYRLNKELSKTEEELTFIYDVSESQITSNESAITYSWNNAGTFPIKVTIMDAQGVLSKQSKSITVQNMEPEANFLILSNTSNHAFSPIEFSAGASIDTVNDKNSLQYLWNWGDNTVSWGKYVSHTYSSPGSYNVSLYVMDDDAVSDVYSQFITIEEELSSDIPIYNSTSKEPYIAIGTFLEEVYEDEEVQFTSEINQNYTDFRIKWSFGDGTYSYERSPKHAWSEVGIYDIILEVIDNQGQIHSKNKNITIKDKAPEIKGPFNFQAVEGQALVLDVEVYDSIKDIPHLAYKWYDHKNNLISTEKKPVLMLSEGRYTYWLNVSDRSGLTSSQEITIEILPISHEIYVPSYMYHGAPGFSIQLRAYLYDTCIEPEEYEFFWTIKHGNTQLETSQITGDFHQILFTCSKTAIYQGEVKVVDLNGNARVAPFEIYSFIDSQVNGIIDEYEYMLHTSGLQTASGEEDSDGDNLPDVYEDTVSFTNKFNPDTDSDGLWDGYDSSGVGELTLATNPNKEDSDDDGLTDYREYYGWDLSINYFENRSTFHINSDPLLTDTDGDGLSDYEEFCARINPRLMDSDGDKLLDSEDPFPETWDKDQDFLSDYMELRLGTDPNITDTDLDGINDGQEVFGWGVLNYRTNPVYADSDNDFLNDFAEILSYERSIEDEYGKDIRLDLKEPVTLHFSEFFQEATLAQISFALTFGEYGEDETQSYGLQQQYIQNLKVIITKPDDNIILYNATTNSTRYFSYVVDVTDIMNNKSLNYYGDYQIEVIDLNNQSAVPKCILEQFKLEISRYLDPLDEDTDDDGIWDGIETELLVEGTDRIDIHDFYNSTVANEDDGDGLNEFYLKVPQTGRIFDGNLQVEITSENLLLGSGNISIQIIHQNVNKSIEDVVLVDYFKIFNEHEQFWYGKSLDLTHLVDIGTISEYCGTYFLIISVYDTNNNDTFIASEFYIETETYIPAGVNDTHAWRTDPALKDSDADGWSDSYEIFTSHTNPLNKDTDGDSAWDSHDRDPFRDVMIEIRPISATYLHILGYSPSLEIVLEFHINDLLDPDFSDNTSQVGFCTPAQQASSDPNPWGAYQTAWWTEGDGHAYYFDVSDDTTIQSNSVSFYFQLWEMKSNGDIDIFRGEWLEAIYSLNALGGFKTLIVEKNGNYVVCRVETIRIERENTIAIFNPNVSDFTGHYNEEERMNIIQLHVAPDGHYEATYSFLNEDKETTIAEWNENEGWIDTSSAGLSPTIINNMDGHHKVLQFYDSSTTKVGSVINQWNNSYYTGTIELWARTSSTTDIATIIIRDGTNADSLILRFDADGNMKYNDGSGYHTLGTYQADRWYHIRFKWALIPHEEYWNVWVDGQNIGTSLGVYGTPVAMDSLVIMTDQGSSDYYFYVDAIGYSFDPEYEIGDNLIRSDCSGTPFKPGPNIIVIPTSLFTKTLLNSYFQNEQLDLTPLYTQKKGLFELYSIDRNGKIVDRQCGDTDFVFIRYDITAHDAMEVLDSLLICATNQTSDENDQTITELTKAFDYVSTQLNGTRAVAMNLPHGVLSFVPWSTNFECSEFGRAPRPFRFFPLIFIIFIMIVFPIALLIAVVVDFFVTLFTNVAKGLGLKILTFLANLLWIIIRTALLILFYILLAIELLTTSLVILPIGLALMVLCSFTELEGNWGLNWWVPYGIDTIIGHISFSMDQMIINLEFWVKWIYWPFFDLFIPLPDLKYDMNSTIYNVSTKPATPTLHCGYRQIGSTESTKFDFYTVYQDENGDPPEFVILNLISPNGSEITYTMTNRTKYNEGYIHISGIEYNVTLDLAHKTPGQWFYYFTTKEDSDLSLIARWPNEYYCEPGPFISDNNKPEDFYDYFLFSDVNHFSGIETQEFDYMVVGADFLHNKIPNNVTLNILLSDSMFQSYCMNIDSSYTMRVGDVFQRNVTLNTYGITVNFSKFIDIKEPEIIRSFYTAEFIDGNTSILFDYYDDKFYNYEFNLTAKKWFDKPILIPTRSGGKPTIVGWRVEDISNQVLADSSSSSLMPIGPIVDEQFLRFWVFISDPDGNHSYHMDKYGFVFTPKLILKNCDSTNPIEPIEMVWAGQNYEPYPECDAYFVDVLPLGAYTYNYINFTLCDFGSGAWIFNFSISDHTGNRINQRASIGDRPKKIWLIGSGNQIMNAAINGYYTSGDYLDILIPGAGVFISIGISVAFIATTILSMGGEKCQEIARYISMGILAFDIINSFIGLGILLCSGDTGTLLGMALSTLISAAGGALAHFLGGVTNWVTSKFGLRQLNLGRLKIMAKISIYMFLTNIILSMICNPTILIKTKIYGLFIIPGSGDEFDWDLPGEDIIRNVPCIIYSFFISTISLGTILNIAELKGGSLKGFVGKEPIIVNPVMRAVKYYTILKVIISTLCIISFIIKTGLCHVIGDFYGNFNCIF